MKKSQFTDEQIVKIVRESEVPGAEIPEVARKHGVSAQTLYRWRARFSDQTGKLALRLKHLERENARLKKLLAERDLELDAVREVLAKKV